MRRPCPVLSCAVLLLVLVGVGCKQAIKAMQAAGMRVIPYINGQLYDTRIPRYANDHANLSVQPRPGTARRRHTVNSTINSGHYERL